jgi:uncharacterized protein (DUF1330 family)
MNAYLIADVDIKDSEMFRKYMEASPEVVRKFGGRFLVRGGEFWIAEGKWAPKRLVVIEFESFEKATEFWHSEDYRSLKILRQNSAFTDMVFVKGISKEQSEQVNG